MCDIHANDGRDTIYNTSFLAHILGENWCACVCVHGSVCENISMRSPHEYVNISLY